jgi:phenylalanyl-tRNA synthetase beta chain
MKILYNWLKNYVKTELSPAEVAALLTSVGLEVETIEPFESIKGGLNNVVIGEVKTCAKHPNADRLSLTTVDIGGKILQIVCGAANVAAGQKVVVATEGAMLYPYEGEAFQIKKSKIRGENSEGMICAEDEIGLGASHAGIMVLPPDTKIGIPAADYFKIYADTIFEVNITPNRADAISHIGVARDLVAAINLGKKVSTHLQMPVVDENISGNGYDIDVKIENPEACPRYSGITIAGIKVQESPQWLKDKMLSIGLRPINNIVDVTNFVMFESGQPLHAFDADAITGKKVIVRTAKAGETIITLDGTERKLHTDDLLICNEKEAMCIAGVYGGANSGVKNGTTNVFLESACFSGSYIRKTARRHSLHTDAAYRFERGTDINGTLYALKRAAALFIETGGGKVASGVKDSYPVKQEEKQIDFSIAYANKLIGHPIPEKEIKDIIRQVGIKINGESGDSMKLIIPTYRMDITTQADIVEEIVRFYGYNNIPIYKSLKMPMVHTGGIKKNEIENTIGDILSANGFAEVMNTSLTSSKFANDSGVVKLANPLSSDLDVLRSSLLDNGLTCIAYNQNHQQHDLRLYEFGRVYSRGDKNKFTEEEHLSLWLTGNKTKETWNAKFTRADFYQVKAYVNLILEKLLGKVALQEESINEGQFEAGLNYTFKSRTIASFGKVNTALLRAHDVKSEVYYADLYWKNILSLIPGKNEIKEVNKFPFVTRDLSLIINKEVSFDSLLKIAYQTEKELLKEVSVFDVYEGDKMEKGKKSYTLRFILQNEDKTLTDKEIDKSMERLIKVYQEKVSAEVRTN